MSFEAYLRQLLPSQDTYTRSPPYDQEHLEKLLEDCIFDLKEHSELKDAVLKQIAEVLYMDNSTTSQFLNQKYKAIQIYKERVQQVSGNGRITDIDYTVSPQHRGSLLHLYASKVIADCFGIHTIYGAILYPGAGASKHLSKYFPSHIIAHSACGYLKCYHEMGPGYEYLTEGDVGSKRRYQR